MTSSSFVVYACDAPGCGVTDVVPNPDFEASHRPHRWWFVLRAPVFREGDDWEAHSTRERHACSVVCRVALAPSTSGWCTYREWSDAHTVRKGHRRYPVRWRPETG